MAGPGGLRVSGPGQGRRKKRKSEEKENGQYLKILSFRVELLRETKPFLSNKLRNVRHLEIFNPERAGVDLNENKS